MLIRDGSRVPTFLGMDAKAFAFIFPTVFVINGWTISYDIFILVLFIYIKMKKMTIGMAYRKAKSRIRSGRVESRPWWFLRKWRNRS
jgi:hypothetical protein